MLKQMKNITDLMKLDFISDSSKHRMNLLTKTSFDQLVNMMVESDIELANKT